GMSVQMAYSSSTYRAFTTFKFVAIKKSGLIGTECKDDDSRSAIGRQPPKSAAARCEGGNHPERCHGSATGTGAGQGGPRTASSGAGEAEPPVGFEPTTARLRIESSTTELRWRGYAATTYR